jgi:hypothetical protein
MTTLCHETLLSLGGSGSEGMCVGSVEGGLPPWLGRFLGLVPPGGHGWEGKGQGYQSRHIYAVEVPGTSCMDIECLGRTVSQNVNKPTLLPLVIRRIFLVRMALSSCRPS